MGISAAYLLLEAPSTVARAMSTCRENSAGDIL